VTPISAPEVDTWLEAFTTCVRARDLDGGRALFDPDAAGFGTVTEVYAGLDALVSSQWSEVWGRTEDFAFDADRRRWLDGSLCVVAATWRSTGTDADGETGGRRTRTGRATVALQRSAGGGLLAVHSHFSMTPGTAA
jgi:ketosteroid isomerase-like protein